MNASSPLPLINRIIGLSEIFHNSASQKTFPGGSTIVISGTAGAGKTTMALALVRSMIWNKGQKQHNHVFYISPDSSRETLADDYHEFGWFSKDDNLFRKADSSGSEPCVHIINPPVELERPVKTSDDSVNAIMREINTRPALGDNQWAYVIVDSVTTLFRDCQSSGELKRQTQELIVRIKKTFVSKNQKRNRLHCIILLNEERQQNQFSVTYEPTLCDYQDRCDFVFKLNLKARHSGTRQRTFEVVKSKKSHLMLGVHTWVIITSNYTLISTNSLQKAITDAIKDSHGIKPFESIPSRWGTVIVCPRPYINLKRSIASHPGGAKDVGKFQSTGIEGLAGILGPPGRHKGQELASGSVTAFASDEFSLSRRLSEYFVDNQSARGLKCLLISIDTEPTIKPDINREIIITGRFGIHLNLLLLEVRQWVLSNINSRCRIVINGITSLGATFSQPNFARAIDALISVSSGRFIDRPVDLSVILTLTVPKGFIPSGLPTPEVPIESVDNLIVVESLVGKRDEHVLTVRRSFCGKHLNTSYFLKQAAGKVCVWEVTSMPDEK